MTDSASPMRVDIVSDVVCPWCVIGYHQLAAAAESLNITLDVHWHPFELNPRMAQEGENLREHLAAKYGTTPQGSREARAKLTALGAGLGFTFNYADDMQMWNTFRAHQLIDWAGGQGRAHETKLALYTAYFSRRRNVSDIDVLASIAGDLGMDEVAARRVLLTDERGTAVRSSQRHWADRGIRGVPAMVFARRHLVTGARGVEAYRELLGRLSPELAA